MISIQIDIQEQEQGNTTRITGKTLDTSHATFQEMVALKSILNALNALEEGEEEGD